MSTAILDMLQKPDPDALAARVTDDVVFHSPAADYRGRPDVLHILLHISSILHDVAAVRELTDHEATTTFITASVEGAPLQGVLDEHHDTFGRLNEATLLLRPYSVLRAAIAAMQTRLADDPLPSTH